MSSCAERKKGGIVPLVFDEDIFRDTVTRERKRADRSGLAMAMLLIGAQDSLHDNRPALFAGIVDAMAAVKSDIDIVGWFERESIMGLIVPDLDPADMADICERLDSNIRKEIATRFEGTFRGIVDPDVRSSRITAIWRRRPPDPGSVSVSGTVCRAK